MPSILTKKERNEELSNLIENGWEMIDGRDAIYKEFKFKSFILTPGTFQIKKLGCNKSTGTN